METTPLLILRITFGLLFLTAAAKLVLDWHTTVDQARGLLGRWAGMATLAGLAVMVGGGLSVLLGVQGRIGAGFLGLFLLSGIGFHVTHLRRANQVRKSPAAADPVVRELAASAEMAHCDAALKNTVLIAVAVLLAWVGTGPGSLWPD